MGGLFLLLVLIDFRFFFFFVRSFEGRKRMRLSKRVCLNFFTKCSRNSRERLEDIVSNDCTV